MGSEQQSSEAKAENLVIPGSCAFKASLAFLLEGGSYEKEQQILQKQNYWNP